MSVYGQHGSYYDKDERIIEKRINPFEDILELQVRLIDTNMIYDDYVLEQYTTGKTCDLPEPADIDVSISRSMVKMYSYEFGDNTLKLGYCRKQNRLYICDSRLKEKENDN